MQSRGRRETVHEESPSVLETGCRRNPGGGDFKESATENYRHASGKVEKARQELTAFVATQEAM